MIEVRNFHFYNLWSWSLFRNILCSRLICATCRRYRNTSECRQWRCLIHGQLQRIIRSYRKEVKYCWVVSLSSRLWLLVIGDWCIDSVNVVVGLGSLYCYCCRSVEVYVSWYVRSNQSIILYLGKVDLGCFRTFKEVSPEIKKNK